MPRVWNAPFWSAWERLIRLANDLWGRTNRSVVKMTGLKGNITKSLHLSTRRLNIRQHPIVCHVNGTQDKSFQLKCLNCKKGSSGYKFAMVKIGEYQNKLLGRLWSVLHWKVFKNMVNKCQEWHRYGRWCLGGRGGLANSLRVSPDNISPCHFLSFARLVDWGSDELIIYVKRFW